LALCFTPQQLAALPPPNPTNWTVEGLLRTHRKRPSLLCGFPGSGKSTLAHQLAIAVNAGEPFLGRKTVRGHVLYWKNEESEQDVREDFFQAGLKTESTNLSILLPEPEDVNSTVLSEKLKLRPDTNLVIVETLADFLNVQDISNNDDCRQAMQNFCNTIVIPNPDCAFLLLHHFNKSNLNAELSSVKIQGGTTIAACSDGKIYLNQISDIDPRRFIKAEVRKGHPIEPTYLLFDPNTLTASLGETLREEATANRQSAKAQKELDLDTKILQLIALNPGQSKWKIVDLVGGSSQRVGNRVDQLIESNFIITRKGGEKGNAILLDVHGSESLEDKFKVVAPPDFSNPLFS